MNRDRYTWIVEMVIYVSFLAVLSGMVVSAIITSMSAFVEFRLTRDINNSATVIMERFVRDVRIAYDVDQTESTLSSHPGRLTLDTTDEFGNATTTEFYVDSGRIAVKEGGVFAGYLSSQNITVDILVFEVVSNLNTMAVTVRLQLSAMRGNIQKTETFYSTTILRGSY